MGYENKTDEELMLEISRFTRELSVKPRKIKVDENGCLLLDPNNPLDRDWFEGEEWKDWDEEPIRQK